jgi:hypothetical protein
MSDGERIDEPAYERPAVVVLGSVEEVTQGGTGSGSDFEFTASPTVLSEA